MKKLYKVGTLHYKPNQHHRSDHYNIENFDKMEGSAYAKQDMNEEEQNQLKNSAELCEKIKVLIRMQKELKMYNIGDVALQKKL